MGDEGESFASGLRAAIDESDVSVRALARDTKIDRRTISRWLAGDTEKPSRSHVKRVERRLGVADGDLEKLVDRRNPKDELAELAEEVEGLRLVVDEMKAVVDRLAGDSQP